MGAANMTVHQWLAQNSQRTALSYGRFRSQKSKDQLASLAKARGATFQPELEALLGAGIDASVSSAACEVLATLGAPAVGPLVAALDASLARPTTTEEVLLRRACVDALADLGPLATSGRDRLRGLLSNADFGLRQASIAALLSFGEGADTEAAVSVALADNRLRGTLALLEFKPAAAVQAASLIARAVASLSPGEIEIMLKIAVVARGHGVAIAEAVLGSSLLRLRKAALNALGAIDAPSARVVLDRATQHPDEQTAAHARSLRAPAPAGKTKATVKKKPPAKKKAVKK